MGVRAAFQMDPLDRLNMATDSTIALAEQALSRGYEIWHYTPDDLIVAHGTVFANARPLSIISGEVPQCSLGDQFTIDLAEADVVFLRQDPPFNMHYVNSTYLLDLISDKTLVFNNPTGIRNSPEKVFPLKFSHLMPPTVLTRDWRTAQNFWLEHQDIILKPLYHFGGNHVFRITPQSENFEAIFDLLKERFALPIVAQKFNEEVIEGDKRIFLLNGEAVGGFKRVPKSGDIRANMRLGGKAVPYKLTDEDHAICAEIGPELRRQGIYFAGIDLIGSHLIEVNVTCPTGIRAFNKIEKLSLGGMIWDFIEDTLRKGW